MARVRYVIFSFFIADSSEKSDENKNHLKMFKKIEEKFMQEETSDVKIICGDKTLYSHRFILDCQSDFFKGNNRFLIVRIEQS